MKLKAETLHLFTMLVIEEVKGELKLIEEAIDCTEINPEDYGEIACACRNIVDVAEALGNLYVAADDVIAEDLHHPCAGKTAGEENIQVITVEKHREKHFRPRR